LWKTVDSPAAWGTGANLGKEKIVPPPAELSNTAVLSSVAVHPSKSSHGWALLEAGSFKKSCSKLFGRRKSATPEVKPTDEVPAHISNIPPSSLLDHELALDIGYGLEDLDLALEEDMNRQNLYKTELCRTFQETGQCRYGQKCQFAHGREELRFVQRHPKYKTEACKTFASTGMCPYGNRCRFIHETSVRPSLDGWTNEWKATAPEKKKEKKEREVEGSRLSIFKQLAR